MDLEKALETVHEYYARTGEAFVGKQHIPTQIVKGGQWAKVIGKSTVDYVGLMRGGRFVAFDAKDCREPRIELSRLQEQYGDKITILKGIELDSHSDPAIAAQVDYFLGSVHELVYEDRFYGIDHARELQQECMDRELGGSKLAFAKAYYEELTAHILRNKPTIVGHFDVLTKFSLMDEDDPEYQAVALEAMEKIVKVTPVMEINTGAISRGWREVPYPAMFLLKRWRELGGEIILGADTHATTTIDCAFPLAIERAKEAGFDHVLTLWPDGFHKEKI
jgi:histidinol-phosphatase (PHP family)